MRLHARGPMLTLSVLGLIAGFADLCSGFCQLRSIKVDAGGVSEKQSSQSNRRPTAQVEISRSHGDGLSFARGRTSITAMLPINPPKRMLLAKPSFAAYTLDSPLDTPAHLYSAGVSTMWIE